VDNTTGIQSRVPPGTAAFITIAVFIAAVQELHPEWLGLAERDPVAFAAGEWWRVVTALFAYDDGPVQKLGIVFGVLALGIVAERKIGTVEWLIIAFVSGLAGQIVGLWWQPYGAGSSVAVVGLLGATATWLAWPKTPLPWFARTGSLVVLALAIALLVMRDIHGPPIFIGAALCALFLSRSG
jgi:rhomboid protease GluP